MIYDFGGGTLDVTILQVGGDENYQIKARTGNLHLGGQDIDHTMVQHYFEVYREETKDD